MKTGYSRGMPGEIHMILHHGLLLIGLSNHTAIVNYKTNTLRLLRWPILYQIINIIYNKMLVRGIHPSLKIQTEKSTIFVDIFIN